MNTSRYAASYPASTMCVATNPDTVVTQGHVDYCAKHGHASEKYMGVESGICPRCGAVFPEPSA